MQFSINIIELSADKEDKDAIYKVSLKDEFTYNDQQEFSSAMSDLIQKGIKKIIIDFNDLTMIDSIGIGLLINFEKKIKKENGELVITRCKDVILTLLRPINIEKLIKIFNNLEDGVDYFIAIKNK
jgi:anti-anti-sigma factor